MENYGQYNKCGNEGSPETKQMNVCDGLLFLDFCLF